MDFRYTPLMLVTSISLVAPKRVGLAAISDDVVVARRHSRRLRLRHGWLRLAHLPDPRPELPIARLG